MDADIVGDELPRMTPGLGHVAGALSCLDAGALSAAPATVSPAGHDVGGDSIYLSPAHVRVPLATEHDVEAALRADLLEENHFLDLKREVKVGKAQNKETARDLAQFAIDGGTVLIECERSAFPEPSKTPWDAPGGQGIP